MNNLNLTILRRNARILAIGSILLLGLQSYLGAQDREWDETDGNWSDASKWSSADVPNSASESAILGGVGTYMVDFDLSSISIDGLNIAQSNATLNISANVANRTLGTASDGTNGGTINLLGDSGTSVLSVGGTFYNLGTFNFLGGGAISRRQLSADTVNHGTLNVNQDSWLTGSLLSNFGTINIVDGHELRFANKAGTVLNLESGGSLDFVGETDFNAGTVNFAGGSMSGDALVISNGTMLNIGFGNTATGTFKMVGTNSLTGDVESGTTLNIDALAGNSTTSTTDLTNKNVINLRGDSGTSILADDGTFTNEGIVNFLGGGAISRRQLAANTVNNGTFNVDQDSWLTGNTLTNNGAIDIAGGEELRFANKSGTVLNLESGGSLDFVGETDFNVGTVNFNGGSMSGDALVISNGTTLNIDNGNMATGTFKMVGTNNLTGDVESGTTLNIDALIGNSTTSTTDLTNKNVINLLGEGGTSILADDGTFTNEGTVNFIGGGAVSRRQLAANTTNNGTFNVDQHSWLTGNTLTNNGTIDIADGQELRFANKSGSVLNLESGGSLDFVGETDFNAGSVNFNGGSISGDALVISNGTLLNIGSGNMATGTFKMVGTNNLTGDVESGTTLNIDALVGNSTTSTTDLTNRNVINLLGDNGTSILADDGSFTNEGTVNFLGGGAISRRQLAADTVNNGTFNVDQDSLFTGSSLTNNGNINIADGIVFQLTNGDFESEGVVAGDGTLQLASGKTTLIDGEIQPGFSPGQLDINGDIEFGSNAILSIELAGTLQTDEYDFLAIGGDLNLGGALSVSLIDGFKASILETDTFTILSASGSLSDIFDGVTDGGQLVTNDGTGSFTVNYSGNDVVLSNYMVIAVPEPCSALFLLAAAFGVAGRRRKQN